MRAVLVGEVVCPKCGNRRGRVFQTGDGYRLLAQGFKIRTEDLRPGRPANPHGTLETFHTGSYPLTAEDDANGTHIYMRCKQHGTLVVSRPEMRRELARPRRNGKPLKISARVTSHPSPEFARGYPGGRLVWPSGC